MSNRSLLDRILRIPEPAPLQRHGNAVLSPALAVTDLTLQECDRVEAILGPQPLPATTGEAVRMIREAINAVRAER